MMSTLAIDAGQTGMKIRAVVPRGLREYRFTGIRTNSELAPQLADAVRRVAADGLEFDQVVAGVSGLTSGGHDAKALVALLRDIGPTQVIVAHDSITSFLGTMGTSTGVVIAAGTGIVTLGVGEHHVARIDGWGNIMGDAGSGHWIGQRALEAVMRAFDGRGPATALTEVAMQRWPVLPEAYMELQASADHVALVASFAEPTANLAAEGDAVSLAILRDAAAEMALSVETAATRVGLAHGRELKVCATGGVFASEFLHSQFEALVSRSMPHTAHLSPQGDGLDGALALAELEAGHPLLDYVQFA